MQARMLLTVCVRLGRAASSQDKWLLVADAELEDWSHEDGASDVCVWPIMLRVPPPSPYT